MATIEELRERDKQLLVSGVLSVSDVVGLFPEKARPAPDDVVFRLTNGNFADVLWLTADGQLHFGPQALAGLVEAVFAQMAQHKLVMTGRHVEGLIESMIRMELDKRSVSPIASGDHPPDGNTVTKPAGEGIHKFHMTAEQTTGDRVTMNPDEYRWEVTHSGDMVDFFSKEEVAREFASKNRGQLRDRRDGSGIYEDFGIDGTSIRKTYRSSEPVPEGESIAAQEFTTNFNLPVSSGKLEVKKPLEEKPVRNPFEKQPPLE